MTARIDRAAAEHWRVEEGDYGQPMIFHRHPDSEHPAYVVDDRGDRRLALCSDCTQYLELIGTTAAIATD